MTDLIEIASELNEPEITLPDIELQQWVIMWVGKTNTSPFKTIFTEIEQVQARDSDRAILVCAEQNPTAVEGKKIVAFPIGDTKGKEVEIIHSAYLSN